jgi:hypothetical protein
LLSCGYEGLGRLWPAGQIAERALELLNQRTAKPARRGMRRPRRR